MAARSLSYVHFCGFFLSTPSLSSPPILSRKKTFWSRKWCGGFGRVLDGTHCPHVSTVLLLKVSLSIYDREKLGLALHNVDLFLHMKIRSKRKLS